MKVALNSLLETKKFAQDLLFNLLNSKREAIIIALEGNLGSGKTTFTRFFGEALDVKENISSPTFVLMHAHTLSQKSKVESRKSIKLKVHKAKNLKTKAQNLLEKSGHKRLIHIDCYRVKENDIADLGFKDFVNDKKNIVIIEWADKIRKIIPKNAIWLKFSILGKQKRSVNISYNL